MVFFSRKKKEESQKLLNRPKSLFGRRRDENITSDSAKSKAGSKRAVRLFGSESKVGTPPCSPNSPLNITVVTTPPSPERQPKAKEYDGEMSEITYSVKKDVDTSAIYSSSLINESDLLTEEEATEVQVDCAAAGEPTAENTRPLSGCSSDTTTDVVNKILGMMDQACASSDRKREDASAPSEGAAPTAAVSRRSDLAMVMSSVFSGVLTRPATATTGEPTAAGDVPTWGVAPSQTEDDDTTQHALDTREALEESLQTTISAEGAPSSRDAAAATDPEKPSRAPVEYEEFELVLGRQANEQTNARRRNWLQRGREYQEEKKEDDLAKSARRKEEKKEDDLAKSARYRAVFGADPTYESPKKNILPAFVKRMSLTGKPLTTGSKPQVKQMSKSQFAAQPVVVTPNTSLRSLRPGLQMEESLRGVHYLEEEPEHEEEQVKMESTTVAAVSNPAVVSPEIEKVQDGPLAINESKRSRSWNQKLQNLVGGGNEEPMSNETEHIPPTPSSLPRTRSSPMRLLGFGGPLKPPKPTWKAAVDPTTGVPYYYHRMTRQTTWSKPRDFDKQYEQWESYQQLKRNGGVPEELPATPAYEVVSKPKGTSAEEKHESKPDNITQPAADHVDVSAVLRKKSPRDFIPEVWDNKQKIVRLLTIMNPPNAESVEKLMRQYEGREDELLSALDELVESQPFDEPMQTEGSLASSEVVEDVAAMPEVVSNNRVRTEATATSGFLSQKTERTEKHRNTRSPYSPLTFDEHAPLSTSTSFSSNLESHEDIAREDQLSGQNNVQVDFQGSNRLNLAAVPRDRELVVEEFTTSRLKKENYDHPSNRRGSHAPRDEAESSYNGDNDETDETETFGEDSISALSEVDGDFQRREHLDLVRQRLVEEANISHKATRAQPGEWKQSELDKFISENGWDAVASYVSKMKDGSEERPSSSSKVSQAAAPRNVRQDVPKSDSPTKSSKIHHPPFAQRKFGARSQLQHSELREDSSCESESSYESDDYTETSYESEDDPSSLTDKVHRKEFVC